METEIICISSDDESDSQKENRKKQSLVTFTEDGSHLHTKVEILPSDEEGSILKRKKSQISKEGKDISYSNVEKKLRIEKLNTSQNASKADKDNSAISDCIAQANRDQEATIEKPKLIVKERKRISYSHDIFPLFIKLCLQKKYDTMDYGDMEKIVSKLKKRYYELDPIDARSEGFNLFLNEKREAIINDDKQIYVHMEEVMNEIKRRIINKPQASRNNETYEVVPSTSYSTNNSSVNNETESDSESDNEDIEETELKMRILIRAMRKCDRVIKNLEEEEVDFEDENNSNYIKVERYKQRIVQLYNKLCKLTGENADAGRAYLRPKHISTTRIVAVDQAITNFINSKISKRNRLKRAGTFTDDLIFPDYRDILECVNRCNEKRNLGLDKNKQAEMAEKAFLELGEYLQRARRNDYWDTFSLYLENKEEDPALKNRELANKLADNRSKGERRLAAIFEKYTQKQLAMKNQCDDEINTEEEDEENSMDNEDEEKDYMSIDSMSDDHISVKDEETNKEDKSEQKEKDKSDTNTLNTKQDVAEVNLNKDNIDIAKNKSNENVEINKVSVKENSTAVSVNGKETTEEERTIYRLANTNNTVVTAKSIICTETQEDSLPASTIDCPSTVNRIEEDVAEVVRKDVSKVIRNSTTETEADDKAIVITEDMMEVTMEDVIKVRNPATKIKAGVEISVTTRTVKQTITDNVTENVREIITENMMEVVNEEEMLDDERQQEEKKPLLRVCSFAKPPTTWEDGRHKIIDKAVKETKPKVTNQAKDVIDLTNESNGKPAPVAKCTIIENKVVPLVKAKQMLVIPSGSNIISVQNITNNYLKVNPRTGQIIAPVNDVRGSTIIRMPSAAQTNTATVRQNQSQSTNAAAVKNDALAKTILRIIQSPSKEIIVSKKSTDKTISKQKNMHSSIRHK